MMKTIHLILILLMIQVPMLYAGEDIRKKLRAWNQLKNARVYIRTDQFQKGLLLLKDSISDHPELAESWYTRGLVHFKLSRYLKACRDWEKACELEIGWCLGEEYVHSSKICP